MKKILYIITTPFLEDISSVIFAQDAPDVNVRVLLTQEGVRSSPIVGTLCLALDEDLLARSIEPFCPTIGYMDLVREVFNSDLVITI